MEKFVIIDGNSLANRAFYAMPYLTNHQKQPSGAVFGFANLLVKLIEQQRPKFLAVAFDHARKTFRNEIFEAYKGRRKETPPELLAQFPVIKQMLQVLGVRIFEVAGFEADDLIGTMARKSAQQNILVSGDRDLLQLVDANTTVWLTRKGVSEIEKFDEAALAEKYGLAPAGIVDLKALMGDQSDNIPGVAGVGEKTALALLAQFGTLDGVYQNLDQIGGKLHEKLENGKQNAYMSRALATIKTDCEIDFNLDECTFDFPFSAKAQQFFRDWDFRTLTARKNLFALQDEETFDGRANSEIGEKFSAKADSVNGENFESAGNSFEENDEKMTIDENMDWANAEQAKASKKNVEDLQNAENLNANANVRENLEKRKTKIERICLEKLADVQAFAASVVEGSEFAYDLQKMEFSFSTKNFCSTKNASCDEKVSGSEKASNSLNMFENKTLFGNKDSSSGKNFSDNKKFCNEGKVFFVETTPNFFSQPLLAEDVLLALGSVFENEKILKITNNSKQDIRVLKKLGVQLKNFFDAEIARYVLFAGLPKQEPANVEELFLLKESLLQQMQQQDVLFVFEQIETPLVQVLADMEDEGFKIDYAMLCELSEKFDAELSELSARIVALAGEDFNINSPKQVAHILFDVLGLKSFNNKKQSTNRAVLEDIRWQHEIVELILAHRKLSKLVSTYVNVYKKICSESGAVIHTVFNQTLTSTGRLSSSEPNLQNIPTRDEEGRTLRKIFVSKHQGGQIISADYNQIELRLLAILANEDSMLAAYARGEDIHTKTASEIFGVPPSQVTQAQRRDAKAVNFGIIYGISDFGLSQNIKTSRLKAKQYIESYFSRYPKIKQFMDQNVRMARESGIVRSHFGRIRHVPEMAASNYMTRKFGERVAMNMPLQGTASDVIKLAMVQVHKRLFGMKSQLILQIHDELIVDAPPQEVEQVKKILKETMENVVHFSLPLEVSVGAGKNLFECK